VSVVELARTNGQWHTVNAGGYARRIHVNTPVEFSGPVAGSALLENPAGNQPKGTVNNCANGYTPWGTYLTCEENFNGYFGSTGEWTRTEAQRRYGFSAGSSYGWHLFDERFDLSNPDYINEDKRFGWIVEIDPMNPGSVPVKRTALGRLKHEGIAIVEGLSGRIVGYMGDDERNDYIYKFVSDANWRFMRAHGKHPLDEGKLYVAKFNDDGTGDWLELTINNPALAANFSDQAEVLVFARQAADILGATPMDRPEWTTVGPNGLVYCTLTNNTARAVPNAPNPLAPNPDGHIIRWLDSKHHTGLTFNWDIFAIAESTHGTEESFASPDGLWADPEGRLFIETDGSQHDGLNDQLLVADIGTGEIKRLFEGVFRAEVTGITTTPDRRTLFCNLQHPDPSTTVPRDATIVITRKDGGIVGS
jgi:secreted PhoX family phosphatase